MVAYDIETSDAIVPENWYILHKLIGTKTESTNMVNPPSKYQLKIVITHSHWAQKQKHTWCRYKHIDRKNR